jgi:Tol biopolymer transport system component
MLFKMSRLAFYCGAGLLCLLNSTVFAGQTTRINVSSTGQQSKPAAELSGFNMFYAQSSGNGRYVTFTSKASNLVDGDNRDTQDVFVHDLLTHKTERISVSYNGKQTNGRSHRSSISADGRYVAFISDVSNLIKDDQNNWEDIFVRDRLTKKTILVRNTSGRNIDTNAGVSISADGRYMVFTAYSGIFFHDQLTHKTELINGGENKKSNPSSISADGRYVAFLSGEPNYYGRVYVYDRQTHKTEQVSVVPGGKKVSDIGWDGYSLSANGRYVAFASSDPSRVVGSTNKKGEDVFVYDRLTHKSERISNASNTGGDAGSNSNSNPSISADGRYVAFGSDSSKLVKDDVNGVFDVFVYDRWAHKMELASANSNNVQANNYSAQWFGDRANLSADGRHVIFTSDASNLVAKDTNGERDVFVRDRLLDTTQHTDLKIIATTKPRVLKLNTKGDYLYTITNNGKDTVPDVSLIHFVSGGSAISFKPSQGKCTVSAVETVCHLGKLATGKKLTLQVTVKVQSKSVNQQITVSGAPMDTVPANNYVTVLTSVK